MAALVFALAAAFQYKKNADLEASYRADLDARAKKAEADAEKRMADAKAEADKIRDREMTLMKDRLSAEKESDATLAAAVRMIDKCGTVMERVERKLG
jgi:regulator of protease activity HflC (stomatin/prohibitin superfamily)